MHPLDVFVLVSGSFSIAATPPLIYLAARSYRDARALRGLQAEVLQLMTDVRDLQHEMHHDQRRAADELEETKHRVERVVHATTRRRLLPRLHLEFPPIDS
jgi:hypothetical protein